MKTKLEMVNCDFFQIKQVKRINRRKEAKNSFKILGDKLAGHYKEILTSATAAALTTTVFIGGSYLFFVQLAEYGW